MAEWRVGRSTGRTLWRDEQLVGMVDSPEIAAEIVRAMNAFEGLKDAARKGRERSPAAPRDHIAGVTGCDCSMCRGPESGRERSLWSDPVYADRCGKCDHPAHMHQGDRCLGDFMSCKCAL